MALALAAPARPRWEPAPRRAFWQAHPALTAAVALLAIAGIGLSLSSLAVRNRQAGPPRPVLRVMTWADPEQAAALDALAQEFNRGRTDVQVRIEVTPYVAYEQKLIVLIAAGDAPDVFALAADRLPLFAEQGACLDLTAWWEAAARANPELAAAVPTKRLDSLRFGEGRRLMALPHPFGAGAVVIYSRTRQTEAAWAFVEQWAERFPAPEDVPEPPEGQPGFPMPGLFGF